MTPRLQALVEALQLFSGAKRISLGVVQPEVFSDFVAAGGDVRSHTAPARDMGIDSDGHLAIDAVDLVMPNGQIIGCQLPPRSLTPSEMRAAEEKAEARA